jgi:putative membrane protein
MNAIKSTKLALLLSLSVSQDTVPTARGQNDTAATRDQQQTTVQSGTLSTTDAEFIRDAGRAGQKEVVLAIYAKQRSDNPAIKQMADTLIAEHTAANLELLQLASRKGIQLPADATSSTAQGGTSSASTSGQTITTESSTSQYSTAKTAEDQTSKPVSNESAAPSVSSKGSLEDFANLSGSDFDRAFVKHIVKDHEKNIAKFERASTEKTLPTLRKHLEMAQKMQDKGDQSRQ